jgi:hypothetical protein
MQSRLASSFSNIGRLLTFRLTREEFAQFNKTDLAVGLACTWLAGIGRTLHNQRVEWWQHAGLGSVAYVFALSLLLYLVLAPLRVKGLSYRHILTFVSLTSPTGFIYAIPVERYLSIEDASTARFWFLAIVAAWRVALLIFYVRRYLEFSGLRTAVVSLLPLCAIVVALSVLNLDKVVLNFMGGGGHRGHRSSDDAAFMVLFDISLLALLAFLPLLLAYILEVVLARMSPKDPPSNQHLMNPNPPDS